MTEKVLDFSNVQVLDTEIPYLVTISKLAMGTSKGAGQDKISAEFTIDEPSELPGIKGRKVFREYSLQPQALFSIYGLLKALGETPAKSFKLNPDKYIGSQVTMWVRTRESTEYGDKSEPKSFAPAADYGRAKKASSLAPVSPY
jgi:hypothetical protein